MGVRGGPPPVDGGLVLVPSAGKLSKKALKAPKLKLKDLANGRPVVLHLYTG